VTTLDIKTQWERQVTDLPLVQIINYQSTLATELAKVADIIVMDECHHASAKTIFNIAMKAKTDSILIGCSATPKREDGEDMKVTAALGEIVYQISRKDLIQQGFLANAKVSYFNASIIDTEEDFETYQEIYKKNIIENKHRNDLITTAAECYFAKGKKVLILVSQIEHGQYLYDHINSIGKIFIHGSSSNRNEDVSKYGIVIASSIYDEGVDLPALDVIILAAGGKSSIKLTQRIGRVLRPCSGKEYSIIIDFIDNCKYLVDHYKKRREILEEDFEVENVG
jgi:superfamily II DNA or RNA helicase